MKKFILLLLFPLFLINCEEADTANRRERAQVNRAQDGLVRNQPAPMFEWSLERHLMTQLYRARNERMLTYTYVFNRSGGLIFSCDSMGVSDPCDHAAHQPANRHLQQRRRRNPSGRAQRPLRAAPDRWHIRDVPGRLPWRGGAGVHRGSRHHHHPANGDDRWASLACSWQFFADAAEDHAMSERHPVLAAWDRLAEKLRKEGLTNQPRVAGASSSLQGSPRHHQATEGDRARC